MSLREIMLRDDAITQIASIVRKLVSDVTKVREELRAKLDIKQSKIPDSKEDIIAVDSAFPTTPIDLIGFSYSIISTVAVVIKNGKLFLKKFRDIMLLDKSHELDFQKVIERARLYERIEALNLGTMVESNKIIVFDGEAYIDLGKIKYHHKEINDVQESLIKMIIDRNITVAGIVKRSYSNYLSRKLENNIKANDKTILSLVLLRGEYIILDEKNLGKIKLITAFYKPLRGPNHAVKLEILTSNNLQVDRLIALLSHNAGHSGYPWFIDLVDSMAKKRVVRLIEITRNYTQYITAVSNASILGIRTNLQEKRTRASYV